MELAGKISLLASAFLMGTPEGRRCLFFLISLGKMGNPHPFLGKVRIAHLNVISMPVALIHDIEDTALAVSLPKIIL